MKPQRLASGTWRWWAHHRGERRTGTSPTRGQAFLDHAQAMVEMGAHRPARVPGMTAGDLFEAYVGERRARWSPTYADDMDRIVDAVPDGFKSRPVGQVTPPVVAGLYRQLAADGWSPHRIHRVHHLVNGAFRLGVANGWSYENPGRDLVAPSFDKPDVNPPEHAVVRAMIAATPSPALRLFFRLASITGARLGELVALRWDDLDVWEVTVVEDDGTERPGIEGTLTIRRAVVYTPSSGVVVRNQTKTGRKGDRRLSLDEGTLVALIAHRMAQADRAADNRLAEPVYMFSHTAGATPWRPGYAGLEWRRLRGRVPGAADVRFHDLRHYVATTMLLDGENPMDVAGQLGHANPATTLRIYAHYLKGRGRESAVRRAGRLDG